MDSKKIGNFVKELREDAGLSQTALANKIFVASSVVSRWESGKASISANNLILLSKIFHVSLDELVAGHKFVKEIDNEKKEVLVGVINSNQKSHRFAKKLVHLIIVMAVIFLVYLVYNFYNSIQLYSIHMDTDKYNIQYGMITKTRDRLYFHLDIDYNGDEGNIECVSIYYYDDESRKLIVESSNINSLSFIDYYGYEEYIKFNEFNRVISNLYLEVQFKNDNIENYKLSFDRTYANIDFFLKKNKKLNIDDADGNELENLFEMDEKINKVQSILSNNNDYLKLDYAGLSYEIFKTYNGFDVSFNDNGIEVIFYYREIENKYFSKKVYSDFDEIIDYRINITLNDCIEGECNDFVDDYKVFEQLINIIVSVDT